MKLYIATIKDFSNATRASVAGKLYERVYTLARNIADALIPDGLVRLQECDVEPNTLMVKGYSVYPGKTETFGWMSIGKAQENLPEELKTHLPEKPGKYQGMLENGYYWITAKLAGKF